MLSHYDFYMQRPIKEVYANGAYIPKRSQKLKNKRLRAQKKKRR